MYHSSIIFLHLIICNSVTTTRDEFGGFSTDNKSFFESLIDFLNAYILSVLPSTPIKTTPVSRWLSTSRSTFQKFSLLNRPGTSYDFTVLPHSWCFLLILTFPPCPSSSLDLYDRDVWGQDTIHFLLRGFFGMYLVFPSLSISLFRLLFVFENIVEVKI